MWMLERPIPYRTTGTMPTPGEVDSFTGTVSRFCRGADRVVGVDDERREELVATREVPVDP